ncbi:MAG TPA: hypothetical protein VM008_04465 [Phycisphaerae bacterium]|nr:hypothetical protein [Phycisphaerae bacterium]
MKKNLGLIFSISLCFILAGAFLQNFRSQQHTQQQLADMQKRLDEKQPAAAPAPAAASATAPALIVQPAISLPTAYAQTHQQVLDVMNAGWKLINQRNPPSAQHAADLFQASIDKIDPNSPDLYNGLGRALLIAGKPLDAISVWKKGLKLSPTFAEMQSGIGWAYWNLHDPYHAKKAWDAAVALDAKSVDAWSALAWIDLALGEQEASKRGFQALLARDKDNAPWLMGLSMAKAGNNNLDEITRFFPLPALSAFTAPVPDPAESAASTAKSE